MSPSPDTARLDAALAALDFQRVDPGRALPPRGAVEDAARAAGFDLPPDYADFCARHGAGLFGGEAWLALPAGCALGTRLSVDLLYAIGAATDHDGLALLAATYQDRLPPGLLPVAEDPGGNLLLLGVADARRGVFAWDHEHGELCPGEFERRVEALRRDGVPVGQYDIDQLLLLWDERDAARVANPSGYGNLYPVAAGFVEMLEAIRR
jgi:hypothetical protein